MTPEQKLTHLSDYMAYWIDRRIEAATHLNRTWAFYEQYGYLPLISMHIVWGFEEWLDMKQKGNLLDNPSRFRWATYRGLEVMSPNEHWYKSRRY